MRSHLFIPIIILAAAFGVGVIVFAASVFDIEFPIPELGNCADKAACKAYCDNLENAAACSAFAKKYGLVSEGQAARAQSIPKVGPGGCISQAGCKAYCDDASHLEECVAFAEQHGFMDRETAENAKKFLGETGPGGCRGANECRAYCEDPEHRGECLEFAHRKGLVSDRDLEVARAVSRQGGPGGCKNEKECKAYCENPDHLDECLDFAEKQGFMTADEKARVKKIVVREGPGGCRGANECRAYCEDPSHQNECVDFAEKNGFMSKEEAERARKFAGKPGPGGCVGDQCREYCHRPENAEACLEFAEREGLIPKEEAERARKFMSAVKTQGGPGGCKGPEECRAFCEDSINEKTCFDFAKQQGFVPPEQEKRFESGIKIREKVLQSGGPGGCTNDEQCRVYCSDPTHVEECVAFGAAHGGVPEEEVRQMLREFQEARFRAQGEFRPPEEFRRYEQEAHQRFQEFRVLEEQFRGAPGGFGEFGPPHTQGQEQGMRGGQGGPRGFVGPGGCASPDECIKYCTEHKEECFSFGPPQGGYPQGSEGPFHGEGQYPPPPQFRQGAIHFVPPEIHRAFEECIQQSLGSQSGVPSQETNVPEFSEERRQAAERCGELMRQKDENFPQFFGPRPPEGPYPQRPAGDEQNAPYPRPPYKEGYPLRDFPEGMQGPLYPPDMMRPDGSYPQPYPQQYPPRYPGTMPTTTPQPPQERIGDIKVPFLYQEYIKDPNREQSYPSGYPPQYPEGAPPPLQPYPGQPYPQPYPQSSYPEQQYPQPYPQPDLGIPPPAYQQPSEQYVQPPPQEPTFLPPPPQ